MKTLTLAASRLLRFHEHKATPCFAAELIGQQSFISLNDLERAYRELLGAGLLVATESTAMFTLPSGDVLEKPLYSPKDHV